jgi:type I restriction enzyme S subunit
MKKGWTTRKLGEVCTTIQDGAHESPKEQFNAPGEGRFLYITSKNIRTNHLDLENVSYVGRDFHDRIYPRCRPQIGDVLLTKDGANTGNVTLNTIDEPFSLLSSVCLIKTDATLLRPAFLCYYLQGPDGLKSITGQMTGAAIKRIILRDIKLATIPLAPLLEQQRIVMILDEAFAGIDTAKANAERNLQNARALFERYLESVFIQSGSGWVEKPLGEVCDLLSGFAFKSGDAVEESSTQLVRMGNLYGNTLNLDRSPVFYPDSFALDYKRYILNEGDLIMSLTGTTGKQDYGYAVRIPKCSHALLMNQRIAKFESLDEELVDQAFLFYYLRSRAFLDILFRTANGTRQANLSSVAIKALPVPLCSLEKQKAITAQLDGIAEETQCLIGLYHRKRATLDALQQSMLHQAFTGEL